MDRLHLINVFVAVVDANGFAGAARQLGLSPPAVTRAITELESQLGARLLTRTTRVVRVTEAGARYVEDCRRILAELAEADEAIRGLHGTPRGRLTVTAPVLFGALYVTPVVTEFLQRYPEVNTSCWFLDRVVNLTDEGVDVAVRIGELPDSSLQAIRVGAVRRVVCAAPAYLALQGTPQRPEDLAAHTLIVAQGATPAPEWRFRSGGEVQVVKLAPRLQTTTNDAAMAAALGGFGLTRLLSYQVEAHVRSGALQPVLEAYEPAPLPVHLVHREGRHASLKARAFLDLAIERLRARLAAAD
ncbi:LysR substrate-binding domain-containing protein [Curvibacter sp. HBC61]|uniref:LysR substrate-binding domain-containing protein n=1 Tax=Curvibacter cyanobacteriorum TaxID=3026422 RepID=A0ABT5MUE7_9BURK|nr:LysR substrate-binding domain-containing protein [Curvibacter sp. HBC61]MDD0837679.1 LysR substrate-binding domain-containing protein [Curvibacter sp. HBC61]